MATMNSPMVRTQTFELLGETQARISFLMSSLDDASKINGEDLSVLRSTVDGLFDDSIHDHEHIQSDLGNILRSYQNGALSSSQLESIIRAEQARSKFLLRLSNSIHLQLVNLQDAMINLTDTLENAGISNSDEVPIFFEDLEKVMASVSVIGDVIKTPGHRVDSTVAQIERNLMPHVEEVLKRTIDYRTSPEAINSNTKKQLSKKLSRKTLFTAPAEGEENISTPASPTNFNGNDKNDDKAAAEPASPMAAAEGSGSIQDNQVVRMDSISTIRVFKRKDTSSQTDVDGQTLSAIIDFGGADPDLISAISELGSLGGGGSEILSQASGTSQPKDNVVDLRIDGSKVSRGSHRETATPPHCRRAVKTPQSHRHPSAGESNNVAGGALEGISSKEEMLEAKERALRIKEKEMDEIIARKVAQILAKEKEKLFKQWSNNQEKTSPNPKFNEDMTDEIPNESKPLPKSPSSPVTLNFKLKERPSRDADDASVGSRSHASNDHDNRGKRTTSVSPKKQPSSKVAHSKVDVSVTANDEEDKPLELLLVGEHMNGSPMHASPHRSHHHHTHSHQTHMDPNGLSPIKDEIAGKVDDSKDQQGTISRPITAEMQAGGASEHRNRDMDAKATSSAASVASERFREDEEVDFIKSWTSTIDDDQTHMSAYSGFYSAGKSPPSHSSRRTDKKNDLVIIIPPQRKEKETDTNDLFQYVKTGEINTSPVKGPLRASIALTSETASAVEQTLDTPVSPLKGGTGAPQTYDDDTISIASHEEDSVITELAIVSQTGGPNGLVTRTYRKVQKRDFNAELRGSKTPLLLLYTEYADCLPDVYKARLLNAGADEKCIKSINITKAFFAQTYTSLNKIYDALLAGLNDVEACNKMANALIALVEGKEYPNELYRKSIRNLYSKMGEIEAMKVWAEVQMVEYRAIFERVNASSITALPSLTQTVKSFEASYNTFVACQGCCASLTANLGNVKIKCERYSLAGSGMLFNPLENTLTAGKLDSADRIDEIVRLEQIIEELRAELEEAIDEKNELNQEVFRVMQNGDRTPGAFVFFAVLHDPNTISVIQQLSLQLGQLKGFADADAHMDFANLRKRLQVCISALPTLERFMQKYSSLYKKWTQKRLSLFTSKGLTGGSADSALICPMCSTDSRKLPTPQLQQGPATGTGANGNAGNGEGGNNMSSKQAQRLEIATRKRIAMLVKEERDKALKESLPLVSYIQSSQKSKELLLLQEALETSHHPLQQHDAVMGGRGASQPPPRSMQSQPQLVESKSTGQLLPTMPRKKLIATIKFPM